MSGRGIHENQQQPTFLELREKFRSENQARIRASLSERSIECGPLRYIFQTDGKPFQLDCTVSPVGMLTGGSIFPIPDVPSTLLNDLADDLEAVSMDMLACMPAGVGYDHDGPPLPSNATEEELLAYTEALVEDKKC